MWTTSATLEKLNQNLPILSIIISVLITKANCISQASQRDFLKIIKVQRSFSQKKKRQNKGQRGQIYDAKPRMSGIYSALEWSIQTPVTVLTYWTIKIFDLYQWAYDDKAYLKEGCISYRADNNDFYLLKPSTSTKRSFPGKNARRNQDNAHFLDKMQKIKVKMWK